MSPEISPEIRFEKPDKSEIASATLKRRLVRDYGFEAQEANNLFADSISFSPKRAYHNYLHHRESLWVGLQLIDKYRLDGKEVDPKAVIAAIMLHDAEDPEDPNHGKYISSEHEAAAILVKNRERYGLTEEQARRGSKNVLATAINAKITDFEEDIMVVSDVGNVGSDDPSFFNAKTALLRVELLKKGAVQTSAQFEEQSAEILSKIWLKVHARNPDLEWVRYASRNIRNFIEATVAGLETDEKSRKRLLGQRAVKEFMRIMQSQPDEKKS